MDVHQRKMLLYRCLVGFCSTAFGFYAVSQMVMADASAIKFTSPILTFFFVRFRCPYYQILHH